MVDTALEIECKACGNKLWYSGKKENPDTVECPECFNEVEVPEEG